nr:MAG TPA: hypothetical protein [Caudoviricetes sp.]
MCRSDRGWRKLSPALTEAGKVSIVKKTVVECSPV